VRGFWPAADHVLSLSLWVNCGTTSCNVALRSAPETFTGKVGPNIAALFDDELFSTDQP